MDRITETARNLSAEVCIQLARKSCRKADRAIERFDLKTRREMPTRKALEVIRRYALLKDR